MAEAKGILGTKLGMTQIFTEDSRAVPVTVIQAGPCVVTQVEDQGARRLRGRPARLRRDPAAARPPSRSRGTSRRPGAKPHRYLVEMRTDGGSGFEPGQEIKADIFAPGIQPT